MYLFFQNLRSRDKQPLVEGDQGDLLFLLWEELGYNLISWGSKETLHPPFADAVVRWRAQCVSSIFQH